MKIAAIAPWFGSKRTLAHRIVAELGEHVAYWEPFCGSMAVLLAKPKASMETVNDLHGDLINMSRCIQHRAHGPALYRRLRRAFCSRDQMDECAARFRERGNVAAPGVVDVDRAFDYFLNSWAGRNGLSGTKSYNQGFSRRFTKNGGHAAKRWVSAVDSIPAWRRRLREVTIDHSCGIELCEKIEDANGVAVYVDPPYVVKGASYVHDFAEADHARLASVLSRFKRTRVVVSYYEHPMVRDLYAGWTFVECPMTRALVNQGLRDNKGAGVKAPEILVINGPSFTSAGGNALFLPPDQFDARATRGKGE